MNDKTVLIIGGGLGGLFTGAILTKEGYDVTVLEKNANIGGGLQTFMRRGEMFETGMHMLGGLRRGGSIHKICHYLGILGRLNMRDVDDDCMDSLRYLSDGREYRIAGGREGFVRSLSEYFPHERENLERYVQALYDLTQEVDFFYLRKGSDKLFEHSAQFLDSANHFIATYIHDKKLQDVLGYMNPMYGGAKDHTPAYIHCLINVLYIDGTNRFVGGSSQLAEALRWVIETGGGKILAGQPVTHIEVQDKQVVWVETKDGTRHTAQQYISAVHPCTLIGLMNEGAVPRSYSNRLADIPNTYSAFTVYLTINDGVMPYINHTCYCQDDYDNVWDFGSTDDSVWPHGFMYMTPPVEGQGAFSTKMIITSPMNFDMVRQWEDTTVGHRGTDYEAWKQEHADRLVARIKQLHPQLEGNIKAVFTSSPLTIRDYYHVKDGSMYGFRKDCQNIALSQVPIFTKVRNLLLTGQNINLHGICGVPLTAINTAEAIVGFGTLVDKINTLYETHQER